MIHFRIGSYIWNTFSCRDRIPWIFPLVGCFLVLPVKWAELLNLKQMPRRPIKTDRTASPDNSSTVQ